MEQLDVVALLKAAQTLERNVSVALLYAGLRVPQFRVLDGARWPGWAVLCRHRDRASGCTSPAPPPASPISELVRAGIAAAVEHPADRRSFHIRLTETRQRQAACRAQRRRRC
ncbi:MAG: hypothetical protein MZV70_39750 [Desulfobacterales bacterium]|nr:hypothetical protein [Desulfobacterales bacterium]